MCIISRFGAPLGATETTFYQNAEHSPSLDPMQISAPCQPDPPSTSLVVPNTSLERATFARMARPRAGYRPLANAPTLLLHLVEGSRNDITIDDRSVTSSHSLAKQSRMAMVQSSCAHPIQLWRRR